MQYNTLSSAIRAGALLSPQAFGQYEDFYGATCSLGAAGKAIKMNPTQADFFDRLVLLYPHLEMPAPCPVCKDDDSDLGDAIICLNDEHRWTREWIADFVEMWENEHLGYETLVESEVTEKHERAPLRQEAALQG